MQIIHIVPLQCININIILKYGLVNCLKQSVVKCIFHDETLIFCPKVTLKLSQQLWSFFWHDDNYLRLCPILPPTYVRVKYSMSIIGFAVAVHVILVTMVIFAEWSS